MHVYGSMHVCMFDYKPIYYAQNCFQKMTTMFIHGCISIPLWFIFQYLRWTECQDHCDVCMFTICLATYYRQTKSCISMNDIPYTKHDFVFSV